MIPQVLAVQARLVQDHPDVEVVAGAYCRGFVNRLTAAVIYSACGCSLQKSRKVVNAARMKLRNMEEPGNHNAQRRYEVALQATALAIAARTTAPRKRKPQPRPS